MGPEQRPPEDLTDAGPGPEAPGDVSPLRYRLGLAEATRRARWAAVVRATSALAPVLLAVVLLHRLGWAPTPAFWAVTAALVLLVATRAGVGYVRARRRLGALVVTVSDDDIHVENARDGYSIQRASVARIVEMRGQDQILSLEDTARAGWLPSMTMRLVTPPGTTFETARRIPGSVVGRQRRGRVEIKVRIPAPLLHWFGARPKARTDVDNVTAIRRPGSGIGRDVRAGGAHLAVGGNNLDPRSVATQIGDYRRQEQMAPV